jgi:hypothetical protein
LFVVSLKTKLASTLPVGTATMLVLGFRYQNVSPCPSATARPPEYRITYSVGCPLKYPIIPNMAFASLPRFV